MAILKMTEIFSVFATFSCSRQESAIYSLQSIAPSICLKTRSKFLKIRFVSRCFFVFLIHEIYTRTQQATHHLFAVLLDFFLPSHTFSLAKYPLIDYICPQMEGLMVDIGRTAVSCNMNKMKTQYLIALCFLFLVSGCTPALLQCFLKFTDFEKTYEFDISKEELKNQLVEAYTYDKSLFLKNFGLTLFQNEKVNSEYRQSVDIWLDKKNWEEMKSEILINIADTLNLLIGKHHSRKEIKLIAIIDGNNDRSSFTIKNTNTNEEKLAKKT